MKKVLLLACALTMMAGCAKKTVEPLPMAKPAIETPMAPAAGTPAAGIYGASGTVAATPAAGGMDTGLTTSTPTVPPEPALVADKAPKAKAAVAPKDTKATKAAAHGKKYVVKKGDTLTAIAKKTYGKASAVKKIVAANPGMDANKIKVGQTIILP